MYLTKTSSRLLSMRCLLPTKCRIQDLKQYNSQFSCFQRKFSISENRLENKSATFLLRDFQLHKLDESFLPKTATLTSDDAKHYFHQMWVIRHMEQEFSRLYKEKKIRGFCHLYSGQEGCCVGMEAGLDRDDSIITAYRSHGWTYTRGVSVHAIIAELLGKSTGCSKGRGGSMHTYGYEFYGGNGIVGAQVPLGAGVAFAHKYRDNKQICVSLYGDGAANQGQIFEAYNMAALWKLPIIFVCENNLYGMGTSTERASSSPDFHSRGDFIPGIKIDGNCLLSVREATKVAAEYCRSGQGPLVFELVTYRYFGHSVSDPGTSYRTNVEVQKQRKETDPIKYLRDLCISSELVSEDELDAISEEALEIVEKASEQAENDPLPVVEDLAKHIFIDGTDFDLPVRGCDQHTWYSSS